MDRREFLKISGFLGTSIAGMVNISEADPYNLWKPIPQERLEKTSTVCNLCESFCSFNVYKRREIVFSILPEKGSYICPKAIAYHNILYNKDRIKTPLLRKGERGKAKFDAISYDKALEILKEKINSGGFYIDAFATGELEKYYLTQLSNKINIYPNSRVKAITGSDYVYFDVENSDLILNFGHELTQMIYDKSGFVTENSKEIINFTPIITNDSAFGSIWYPVKIEEINKIVIKIKKGLKGEEVEKDLKDIIKKIKSSKKVCITFSGDLAESYHGALALNAIIDLAKTLNIINNKGGIYFYKHQYGSNPFNLFEEKPKNYIIYNFDPFLMYPVKELKETLSKTSFIVYFGNEKSDIANYADLIIPIPYFFEKSEVYVKRESEGFKYIFSPQAIQGGVESIEMRDKANIELLFQKIFNFKAPYGIKDIDEVAKILKPQVQSKNIIISELKKKLPYAQVNPVTNEVELLENTKLSLFLYSDYAISLKTRGSKWAEEMGHQNPLLINPKTAEKFGIKNAKEVILRTKDGNIKVGVFLYEGIAEDVLALKRFKKTYSLNAYSMGDKNRFSKDKEEQIIWWKKEDIDLELIFKQKGYKNVATLYIDSLEIIKG